MKLVKVKWHDANIQHGWQSDIEDCSLASCEDAGWIIFEDDTMIIISRGISGHAFYNSPMAIPRGCVLEIKELRVR